MTTASVALFAGALLGIALISRVPIWILGAWKQRSPIRLLTAHLITYILVSAVSAYGQARGGPPQWHAGLLIYALPALLVFLFDLAQLSRHRSNPDKPDIPNWFIHSAGNRKGPLVTEAVQAALADGSVKVSDWIWRDGFPEWTQISAVDLTKNEMVAAPIPSTPAGNRNNLWRRWRGGLATALTSLGAGVFRSANKIATSWSGAAKLATVIGGLAILSIILTQGAPRLRELADALLPPAEPRYSLQLLGGNRELVLKGPMDAGISDAVASRLSEHPTVTTLHLDSPGGDAAETDRLRDLILAKGLNTYVTASCSGSCVTVFAAGKARWLARTASLILHKPVLPGAEPAELDAAAQSTRLFLSSRGVRNDVIERGLAASPETAWRPSHAELFDSRLATSYATDAEVSLAGIPFEEIRNAETELDKVALYRILRSRHPKAHAELLAIVRDQIVKGQTMPQLRKRMWAVIAPILNDSIPSASETALIAFYQVAIDEAEAFARKDAASCEAFLRGQAEGFDVSILPVSLQERELAAAAELIRSSGSYSGKPVEQKDVVPAFAQVLAAASASGFSPVEFQQAMQFKLDPARNCQGMILFFRSLLAMNDPDRTALLRFMAQQAATL